MRVYRGVVILGEYKAKRVGVVRGEDRRAILPRHAVANLPHRRVDLRWRAGVLLAVRGNGAEQIYSAEGREGEGADRKPVVRGRREDDDCEGQQRPAHGAAVAVEGEATQVRDHR